MQKWEYLHVFFKPQPGPNKFTLNGVTQKYDDTYALFTDLGEQGWELVTVVIDNVNPDTYYFKRPKHS